MVDLVEMKPISSGKAKASTNGDAAKGSALATVCIKYATKRMEQEEKEQGKLAAIVRSIAELPRDGHKEFRAELSRELELIKELHKIGGGGDGKVTSANMAGYSLNSFKVLVTNWRTISMAVECGYKPENKPWALVLAESVAMKHAEASAGTPTAELPTKRKAGRKAKSQLDKCIDCATVLVDDPVAFMQFVDWVNNTAKAMKASNAK
jgi:hypothetical protein